MKRTRPLERMTPHAASASGNGAVPRVCHQLLLVYVTDWLQADACELETLFRVEPLHRRRRQERKKGMCRASMSSRAAAATGTEKVGRLVSSRLRIIQRDYLTRRGGRTHQLRSSVAIDYTPTYVAAYKNDPAQCPRLIDAEAVHGDEQAFWSARREFYRGGASRSYYPTWDRQAQALILFTRDVPRIPQEAAFRLFILGLRMTLLPRLVAGAELMLPSWITMNAEGFLGEGLEGKTANADSGSKAPAAAAATGATSPSSTPSEVPGDGNSATEAEKK